jgi:hypothetical protein
MRPPSNSEAQEVRPGWARRLFLPLIVVFRQGTDPSRMAESIAFGTFLGILPLPGLNSVFCAVLAVRRGLNMGIIQAVNWILLPAQIALFLPMNRLGAFFFLHQPLPFASDDISSLFKAGTTTFFKTVGFGFLDAIVGWCFLGIPLCLILFRTLRYIFERKVGLVLTVKQGVEDMQQKENVMPQKARIIQTDDFRLFKTDGTLIRPGSVIGRPLHYIAFWQAMSFILLVCALWTCEAFGLLHEGPVDVKRTVLMTTLIILSAFIAVSHTYIQERRILRGLITICSYCRKIRVADHLWTQIEQFVSQHSHADFTHGVCPDCFQKLTDKLTDEKDADQKDQQQVPGV